MNIKTIIITFFCIIFYTSSCFALNSDDITIGLSLEKCLSIALNNHPMLKKAKSTTRGAFASLEQIKALNRVKIELTGKINYYGDYKDWDSSYHTETFDITAQKTLYDTGINKLNRMIQAENIKGVLESERQTVVKIAADAKKSYYDLVLKILNRDVEREKVNNFEEHLKTTHGIYEVGNCSLIEVTKAEADLAEAQSSLLKAENDIHVSQEALKVAMGVSDYEAFNLVLSTKLFLPEPVEEIEQLLSIAMKNRADYRKIFHTIKQRELEIKVAARDSSPTITGSLGSDLSKREGASATINYNASINLSIPIEDGGMTKAKIESARAQLGQDTADEENLRLTITRDLKSAALSLENAIQRVKTSEMSMKYAKENLALAQGRYEVGVGNALEVSDAVSTLASSRYTFYQALYDAQITRTELDEAMGNLPPELGIEGSI